MHFVLILSISIALISSLDFDYESQHSLIDVKSHYIPSLDKYGFAILNNQKGNLILQPFQKIEYFYLCTEYQVYEPEQYCQRIDNLMANTDYNLGIYQEEDDSLILLFGSSDLEMKYFFDQAEYDINIDNDLSFKCFDFFQGYKDLAFNFISNLNHSTIINIQFITNGTINNDTSINLMLRNENYKFFHEKYPSLNYIYELAFDHNYSLYYSPPYGENIHSMLCLTFSDSNHYEITNNTQVIPIITRGYHSFHTHLEEEWNITTEYYYTTFYFYADSLNQTYINCSVYWKGNGKSLYSGCELKKNDTEENLYTSKILAHKDSDIYLWLYFDPKLIDENCRFGCDVSFNKSVSKYDPVIWYSGVLHNIVIFMSIIYSAILVFVGLFIFVPFICEKNQKK